MMNFSSVSSIWKSSDNRVMQSPTTTSGNNSMQSVWAFLFVLLLFCSSAVKAVIKLPPNVQVPAVFAFGDSLVDNGNNNNIITPAKANFFPYGKDLLIDGKPTGRFSNGRTAVDFIAEELGIKKLLPAYQDPKLQTYELATGVTYASGASGFDPTTAELTPCFSLTDQIRFFKDTISKLNKLVGVANTSNIVKNSFYVVISGNDDFIVNYFNPLGKRKDYDVDAYTTLLASFASDFIKKLYEVGARRIAFAGVAPIGCIPALRTVRGGIERSCADQYNEAAQSFNNKLMVQIQSLRPQFPEATIVYFDLYGILDSLFRDPRQYGFETADTGCCGTGYIEVAGACNPLTHFCPDAPKRFFWDSFHPSQEGYRVLVNLLLAHYVSQFF